MKQPSVMILGAGISGLTTAWQLKRNHPNISIKILEKKDAIGGVIGSIDSQDFNFSLGPKTFAAKRSKELLSMIDDLSLQSEIVFSKPEAAIRYVYHDQKLHKLPGNPLELMTCPIMRKALFPLVKELFIAKGKIDEDETVGDFFRRRFGSYITDTLVDPFVLGIYAADLNKLSVMTCFGFLKELEKLEGSVIKGMLKRKINELKDKRSNHGLLTLKGGLVTLVKRIQQDLKKELILDEEVMEVKKNNHGYLVVSNRRRYEADEVVFAMNLETLKNLSTPFQRQLNENLGYCPSSSIITINLGYHARDVLTISGFGYLVPTIERDCILGVMFDSEIFECKEAQTKLSVMIGYNSHEEMIKMDQQTLIQIAEDALKRHLKITRKSDVQVVTRYPHAIAQFPVGYKQHLRQFESFLNKEYPGVYLVGNYLRGACVNSCIVHAKKIADSVGACL